MMDNNGALEAELVTHAVNHIERVPDVLIVEAPETYGKVSDAIAPFPFTTMYTPTIFRTV